MALGVEGYGAEAARVAEGCLVAGPAGLGVCGDHELLGEIARGGMGVVCRARQRRLNRVVALKLVLNGHWAAPIQAERFRLETEAAARLDHPNIVPIYEVGEHLGQPYFSMKLLEGGNLADAIARADARWTLPAPLDADAAASRRRQREIARRVLTIAQAVHFAHQRGVLHRDLKPTNILLDAAGEPHLTDFGLAKVLEEEPGNGAALTQSLSVMGTPAYMSPEQALGRARHVTLATDIYSLGAILYELLCARPPFSGDTPLAILDRVRAGDLATPRSVRGDIDVSLETICLKCLRLDPASRYGSADELAEDLQRWLDSKPILARPVRAPERLQLWSRRNPFGALAVGLLVLLTGISTLAAVRLRTQRDQVNAHLAGSLLAQARAQRLGTGPDRREANLGILAAAARIRLTDDLRQEAIAALALPSLGSSQVWHPANDLPFHHQMLLSADGRRFALFGQQTGIAVHDRESGRVVAELDTPAGHLFAGAISPDGRFVVSFDAARAALVWDMGVPGGATRRHRPDLEIPGPWEHHPEFTADGRTLVMAGLDGHLRFLDPVTGQLGERIELPAVPGRLAIAPASDRLAIAFGNKLEVWPRGERGPRRSVENASTVTALAWHPSGRHVAVGCDSGDVQLVDVESGERRWFSGHRQYVNGLAFSTSGEVLASSSWDSSHRYSDTATGRLLFETNDSGPVQAAGGGRWFALLADDGGIRVREYRPSRVLKSLTSPASGLPGFSGVDFSPDGNWIVSGTLAGWHVWDRRTGAEAATVRTLSGWTPRFHPSGRHVVLGGRDRLTRWKFEAPPGDGRGGPNVSVRLEAAVTMLSRAGETFGPPSFDADGSHMSVGGRLASYVFDWDKPGEPVVFGDRLPIPGHDQSVLDPGAQWVVGAAYNGSGVNVWDARTGRFTRQLVDRGNAALALSSDGKTLATATATELILWDTAGWEPRRRISTGLNGGVPLPVAFSPDDSILAFAATRQSIALLDAGTFRPVATLTAPIPLNMVALRFSRGGSHLAAQTLGPVIEVWDLATLRAELGKLGLGW